jgi:hypothetical protein
MIIARPFAPADLEACYAVSLATGCEGGDASHLYRDPKMMGHIYIAPYAVLDPALALAVEDSLGVSGFAVGAADTVAWEARLERAADVGAGDVHVSVNRANGGAIRFWARHGFEELTVPEHEGGRTLWMGRSNVQTANKPLSHAVFSASIHRD